jgi:hypothetical protein
LKHVCNNVLPDLVHHWRDNEVVTPLAEQFSISEGDAYEAVTMAIESLRD